MIRQLKISAHGGPGGLGRYEPDNPGAESRKKGHRQPFEQGTEQTKHD